MPANIRMNRDLAIFLGKICLLAYDQYNNNGHFKLPYGYRLIKSFKAEAYGREEWFGFVIQSRYNVIVAFRGSETLPDWISDMEVSQVPCRFAGSSCETHRGFTSIYESCREEIIKTLDRLPWQQQVYVTGHSLGAAMATLNALDISQNTRFKNPIVYNFASPRVGSPEFASVYNQAVAYSVRIVNLHDIVPVLPSEKSFALSTGKPVSYEHVLDEFRISAPMGSIVKNHALETYIDALYKLQRDYPYDMSGVQPFKPTFLGFAFF